MTVKARPSRPVSRSRADERRPIVQDVRAAVARIGEPSSLPTCVTRRDVDPRGLHEQPDVDSAGVVALFEIGDVARIGLACGDRVGVDFAAIAWSVVRFSTSSTPITSGERGRAEVERDFVQPREGRAVSTTSEVPALSVVSKKRSMFALATVNSFGRSRAPAARRRCRRRWRRSRIRQDRVGAEREVEDADERSDRRARRDFDRGRAGLPVAVHANPFRVRVESRHAGRRSRRQRIGHLRRRPRGTAAPCPESRRRTRRSMTLWRSVPTPCRSSARRCRVR